MKKFFIMTLISTIFGCGSFHKEIVIPRDAIQSAIEKKFPYDKNMVLVRVSLKEPNIYFIGTNIGISINYWANFMEKEIDGRVGLNGHIRYEKGAFYMDSLDIKEVTMNEKEFFSDGKLKKALVNVIKNYLESYPIYRLKQTDFKQNLASLFLKNIIVDGDSLKILIGI
jgi:hypothetical protein